MLKLNDRFSAFSHYVAQISGRPSASILACAVVLLWVVTGPLFSFSDTWQLVINTATTIITFLMVFIIQNTQNRDGAAIQIKLDEIIRAIERADNVQLDLEDRTQEQLDIVKKKYTTLAKKAHRDLDQASKKIKKLKR